MQTRCNGRDTKCARRIQPLYAVAYRHMYAIELQEAQRAHMRGCEPPQVSLHFKRGPDCIGDTMNQVMMKQLQVSLAMMEHHRKNRDIIVYPKDRGPQRISYMSCHLDPMCSVVLALCGLYLVVRAWRNKRELSLVQHVEELTNVWQINEKK